MFSLWGKPLTSIQTHKNRNWLLKCLTVCALVLWLQGCQNLPLFSSEELHPVTPQITLQESINTHTFKLSGEQTLFGVLARIETGSDDNLPDIARHFGLGYNDIVLANPTLDPWVPAAKQQVLLPARFILPDVPHKGIVINLANMRLFYFPIDQKHTLYTYPVGIGRQSWGTPTGLTEIIAKRPNPSWVVPDSIQREHAAQGDPLPKVVPSGPDNPLGHYAMPLGFNSYLIHGTNKPYGIGMQVSHGCIQLYPEDIEVLYKMTPIGTPVRIVHQPYMLAWEDNKLYLEAHPLLPKWEAQKKQLQKNLYADLRKLAKEKPVNIDWLQVEAILQRSDGVPKQISKASGSVDTAVNQVVELKRPDTWAWQNPVARLNNQDIAVLAASFKAENDAKKFAAMLNHQGPPIPARTVRNDKTFLVIAGPFNTVKQANQVIKRIKINFEMNAKLFKPDGVLLSGLN